MTMMSINGRELLEYEEKSCTSNELAGYNLDSKNMKGTNETFW